MTNHIYKTGLKWLTLVLLMLLSIMGSATPSQAAEASQLEMKNLDLQVWPEYDDPKVLNIFNGTFTNTSGKEYSGKVHFVVPKNIDIKMACELINGGQHSCQLYNLEDKGSYQILSWKTSHPIQPGQDYPIWLEYYYNPLKGSPNKTMAFDYLPYYRVQNLKLTVKEPLNSTNFKIEPAPSSTGKDTEGFTNNYYTFKNLKPNKPLTLQISYTRSDAKPSVQPVNSSGNQQGVPQGIPSNSPWKNPVDLFLVFLLVAALVMLIFYSFYRYYSRGPVDRIKRIHNQYGKNPSVPDQKNSASRAQSSVEKKRLHQMLMDGEIDENTYRELTDES